MGKYNHAEAYCHMIYANENKSKVVSVYNTRDGVTPFIVSIENEMFQHIAFGEDYCEENYTPIEGDYVFTDYTEEAAKENAEFFYQELKKGYMHTLSPEAVLKDIEDKDTFIKKEIDDIIENGVILQKVIKFEDSIKYEIVK